MNPITFFSSFYEESKHDVHMRDESKGEFDHNDRYSHHDFDFPAFKSKPVLISGFLPEAIIMHSKEKPKKIGIVGSDGNVYNFLLKCDK
jgi:phosphatidylinositol kinase/protein kinase (PI-3  family)